jgi:hypothetical protein
MVGIEPTTLGLLDPRSNQLSYTSGIRETNHPFPLLSRGRFTILYSAFYRLIANNNMHNNELRYFYR